MRSCCPLSTASTISSGAKLTPIASRRTWCGSFHAGQNSNVCCSVSSSSSQWWHVLVNSRRILSRNSPNAPCPVSTYVILYVSGSPPRSLQATQFGRITPKAWWDRTVSLAANWMRHRSQVSSFASSRTSRTDWSPEGVSLSKHGLRSWLAELLGPVVPTEETPLARTPTCGIWSDIS